MFDQIKTEPLHFYQSSCPTQQITTQIVPQHQAAAVMQHQQNRVQHTVITINDDKDNLQNVSDETGLSSRALTAFLQQHNDMMPTLVEHIKPEIMSQMPQPIIHQTQVGGTATQTTSTPTRGSKPQACKVCGKVLSSASSYYVHMKLHSGTKPFQCESISQLRSV